MNDAMRQDLIEEFMETVREIAEDMQDDETMPLEDLIQEGYVGLLSAVNALREEDGGEEMAESGLSLTEVITDSIRSAMQKALEENSSRFKTDDRLVVQVELMNRSIERLTEELGTKPNIDEIANDMKVPQDTVLRILKLTGESVSDEALTPPSGSSRS